MGTGVKSKMVPDRSGSPGAATGAAWGESGEGALLIHDDEANRARVGKGFLLGVHVGARRGGSFAQRARREGEGAEGFAFGTGYGVPA